MLGKQHIFVTSFFLIAYLSILIFSYFHTGQITLATIIPILISVVYKNYIFLILFSIGVMISATAPDIDISSNIKGIEIWNKLTRFGYILLVGTLLTIIPNKDFAHRHLYHSFIGMIMYSVIIVGIAFSILFGYTLITAFITTHSISLSSFSIAYQLFLKYEIYVEMFIIGCSVGFFSHLLEDSITVSGIDYLPFITKKRLAGKFVTVGKNGIYKKFDGTTMKVGYFKRSQFGAWLDVIYALLFVFLFFYFNIYLYSLVICSIIFLLGLLIFDTIFCGLKIIPY